MNIRIDNFHGIQPRLHPSLLVDGMAVRAHNCRLKSGKLVPLKKPRQVHNPIFLQGSLDRIGNAKSLYLWRRNGRADFVAWKGVVRVAQSNLADDERARFFASGDVEVDGGGPVVFVSNVNDSGYVVRSLIKEPLPAPSLTVESPTDANDVRYAVWYQTWVDALGYESPTSDGSDEVSYSDGQSVTVGMMPAPSGAVARRFYKTVAGTSAETDGIQFVYEQQVVQGVFPAVAVAVKDEDCGEAMPDIKAPPADLRDMQFVSGAFYAGWSPSNPRTVMFSDVDLPYSWPLGYRYDVRDEIVGVIPVKNSVYVLTKGYPSVLSGYAPESMTVTDITSRQGCVSARSIVAAEGSVYYASADGICQMNPDTQYAMHVNLITDKYISKEQWAALAPETCFMEEYDGALFAWFSPPGRSPLAYIFDLKEGSDAITTHDFMATCAFYDCVDDELYCVGDVEEEE